MTRRPSSTTRKPSKPAKPRKSGDDLELQLELKIAELEGKKNELQRLPERIQRERREREMTIPPDPGLEERRRAREHEARIVTHGQVENVVREHNGSVILILLLAACIASLAWWASKFWG